ncbi:MAG TPA: hypothetical protein VLU25_09935 [Acidobacteriota bacterium]|nr:hypothetical protein [Acidobacteriota bacterium]
MRKTLIGLFWLCLLTGPAWAQPAFPVAELQLPPDCGSGHTVTVPLSGASSEKYGGQGPSIVYAEFEGTQHSNLTDTAQIEWGQVIEGSYRHVVLRVDCDLMRGAGSYRFLIHFPGRGQTAAAQQFLTLKRPPAALHLPAELRLDRPCLLPGPLWCRDSLEREFSISETTGSSKVSHLEVQPELELKDDSFGSLQARLSDQEDLTIPAGRSRSIGLLLSGELPLGTTRGTLRFTAPQLSDWQSVDVVVRNRLRRWNIGVFVLAGLLGSFFLKIYLKNRLQLAESQKAAAELLVQARDLHQRYADPEMRKAIEESQEKLALDAALENRNAEAIATAVTAYRQLLDDALKSWRSRREALLPRIENLRKAVERDWKVPATVSQSLETPSGPLKEADKLLREGNVSGAEEKIDGAEESLVKSLRNQLKEWTRQSRELCRQITDPNAAVPPAGREAAKVYQARLEDSLSGFELDSLKAEAVPALLSKVETARRELDWVCQETAFKMRSQAETVRSTISAQESWPDPESLQQGLTTLDRIAEEALTWPRSPRQARERLSKASARVKKDWDRVLQAQQVDSAIYLEALKEGDLIKAVQAVAKAQSPPPAREEPEEGEILGGGEAAPQPARALGGERGVLGLFGLRRFLADSESGLPPMGESRLVQGGRAALPFFSSLFSAAPQERLSARRLQVEARKAIWWSKFYQTLLIFLIFTLWGIWFFWDDFVGDFQQFAQIFFWAFGLDITVDRLLEATREKPGKGFAQ